MNGKNHNQKENKISQYWDKRKNSIYLKYVDYIVCAVGKDAESIVDVGSRACGYLEWFNWIDDRASLDIKEPYTSERVRSITADFFDWEPDKRYDVALCLQVMEHIPDTHSFGEKLLSIADHVVISVPYKWADGSVRTHVHDPIDMRKFNSWFPVKPNWSVVAKEPFSQRNGDRIVAYFDTQKPGSKRFRKTRRNATARMNLRDMENL